MSRRIVPVKTWHQGIPDVNEQTCLDSEQVFFHDSGLLARWSETSSDFVVAETNFSIGLNTLLACHHWLVASKPGACLHYFTCITIAWQPDDLARIFARWPRLAGVAEEFLDVYPILVPGFHRLRMAEGRICLNVVIGDPLQVYRDLLCCADTQLEPLLRTRCVDVWFATAANHPELERCMRLLSGPQTQVIGLTPADTRVSSKPIKRQTPWAFARPERIRSKRAMVLGAGLAGCFTAHALTERGWKVVLIDKGSTLAAGASGNPQTILYPALSAWHSPMTDFMLSAYLYASRWYRRLLDNAAIGELRGILQLADTPGETHSQHALKNLLSYYPSLGSFPDAEQASLLAGIPVSAEALYLPLSGWLDTPALCQWLVTRKEIQIELDQSIDTLNFEHGQWYTGRHQAEVLVLANAFEANRFEQTQHLPLTPVAGQLTQIAGNENSSAMAIPLCASVHILPQRDAGHYLGATYHPENIAREPRTRDDQSNLASLNQMPLLTRWSEQITGHWYGTRAATPDYLPIVGPAPDEEAFKTCFAKLATDNKRWIAASGTYYPGLYVCAGFGSRGLTSIPLCADWLASQINQEMNFLPRGFVQALSAARFIVKRI